MARPSMKAQRTDEILSAFKRCIVHYGLEGSSLEHIAEESGLQRSLIRHFVGNRDDLIHLLADRMLADFKQQTEFLYNNLPKTNRIEALIGLLFEPKNASSTEHILVFESLIASAERYPKIRTKLQKWLDGFNKQLTTEIEKTYPNSDHEQCNAVSFGIISIYFNLDSLMPLSLSDHYRKIAVIAATSLLRTLDS